MAKVEERLTLDPVAVREDFPILFREVNGKPLVYLDNAATTQKPRQVIDALTHYYEHTNANVHRGIHELAEEATAAYEGAREKVAAFIGAADPRSIIFTRGTTESVNLVAHGWGRRFLKEGDEIVLSEMEHHSNIVPWQMCARATGAVLRFAAITDEGVLSADAVKEQLSARTRIVAITGMSNVLGTLPPVAEIVALAHDAGAVILIDGAQLVPHAPVDVEAIGCDFLTFSGHKMLGPTASGGLYGRLEVLDEMDPFLGGGEMILEVLSETSTYKEPPWKFEAGTPNIAQSIGLGAAVDYLEGIGMKAVRDHEREITGYAIDQLKEAGATVFGPADPEIHGGAVSFWFKEVHPHDLATILNEEGVAIRAGHHCAQLLMRRLDVPATARASFYVYNTNDEIDALVAALRKAEEVFG
jgi:cysteine desulfurase/selenocysteine lyase